MQNGFYRGPRAGRDRLLDRDGQVPARLPGAYRCVRLRDRHRRRPLRRRRTASRAPPTRSPPSAGGSAARPAKPTAAAATWMRRSPSAPLKRFVTDQFGPETGDYALLPRGQQRRACCRPTAAITSAWRWSARAFPASPWRTTWCSIGYKVTVFEADAEPGGMLTVGVPVFRLPRELVRHEINAILSLGVELKCNMRLGRDFTIAGLRARRLQGHLPGHRPAQGPQAAAARRRRRRRHRRHGFSARLQRRQAAAAGQAHRGDRRRQRGLRRGAFGRAPARRAHGLRRGPFGPAHERRQGSPRGLPGKPRGDAGRRDRSASRAPRKASACTTSAARAKSCAKTARSRRCARCAAPRCSTRSGRFNPAFDESHIEDIPADSVIFAIGQTSDLRSSSPADGVETRARPDQGEPRDLPDHRARCLRLRRHRARRAPVHRRHRLGADRRPLHARFPARHAHRRGGAQAVDARGLHHGRGLERDPRARIRRSLESDRRAASLEIVEESYRRSRSAPPGVALPALQRQHGLRHLHLRGLQRLRGRLPGEPDPPGGPEQADRGRRSGWRRPSRSSATSARLPPEELDQLGGVMMKDETTCIRCAMCASRCPTHAITMKQFDFYRECVTRAARPTPRWPYRA